jgi:predicted methyltransferase
MNNFLHPTTSQSIMSYHLKVNVFLTLILAMLSSSLVSAAETGAAELAALAEGEHRSAANRARNAARHPVQTLEFFGLEPDMTVIEIGPSGGWYTEILAPYLHDRGRYYGAHFSPNSPIAYHRPNLENFEAKLREYPALYGRATVRHLLPPQETVIGPEEGADLALTFRNVHNWIMAGQEAEYFAAFYAALKPGGILGVVEHRAPPGSAMEVMETTGYVTEDYVRKLASDAGFEFVAAAEINANPRDTKDYSAGVWTLPPTYRLGEQDRERYRSIGESDRMTLKFRKPQ